MKNEEQIKNENSDYWKAKVLEIAKEIGVLRVGSGTSGPLSYKAAYEILEGYRDLAPPVCKACGHNGNMIFKRDTLTWVCHGTHAY